MSDRKYANGFVLSTYDDGTKKMVDDKGNLVYTADKKGNTTYPTYLKNVSTTNATYPEYPTVSCTVYYKKESAVYNNLKKDYDIILTDTPIKNKNVNLEIKTLTPKKENGTRVDEWVVQRTERTDIYGNVTLQIVPMKTYEYNSWADRIISPKIEKVVDENGNESIVVNNNITDSLWTRPYSIRPLSPTETIIGLDGNPIENKYSCKIVFPQVKEKVNDVETLVNQNEPDFDNNATRYFTETSKSCTVEWWKQKNEIYISKCIGTYNDGYYEINGTAPQKVWFHYANKSNGKSNSGIKLNYTITKPSNISVTKSSNPSDSQITTMSGTGKSGLCWFELKNASINDNVTIHIYSEGNSFVDSTDRWFKTKWINNGTYSCSSAIQSDGIYKTTSSNYTVKATIKKNNALCQNETFYIYQNGKLQGTQTTDSNGVIQYTFENPLDVMGMSAKTNISILYKPTPNSPTVLVITQFNTQYLNDYSLRYYSIIHEGLPTDEWTVFSKKTYKVQLKNAGTPLAGKNVNLKVEYSRDSEDTWEVEGELQKGKIHTFTDTLKTNSSGIIEYKFMNILTGEDGIEFYADKSIRYAGLYKFTFQYYPTDGHGCEYSFTRKFETIPTHFNINQALAEYSSTWYYVGMNCRVAIKHLDKNDVPVPNGWISRYITVSDTVDGVYHVGEPIQHLEPRDNKGNFKHHGDYHLFGGNTNERFRPILTGKHGGSEAPFIPLSKGNMSQTSYFEYFPEQSAGQEDTYSKCTGHGTACWKKRTPGLSIGIKEEEGVVERKKNPANNTYYYELLVNKEVELEVTAKTILPKSTEINSDILPIKDLDIDYKITFSGTKTDGTPINKEPIVGSDTTNNDGKISLGYIGASGVLVARFSFVNKTTDIFYGKNDNGSYDKYYDWKKENVDDVNYILTQIKDTTSDEVRWKRYPTKISKITSPNEILENYVENRCSVSALVTYNDGTNDKPLTTLPIKKELIMDNNVSVSGKESMSSAETSGSTIALTPSKPDNTGKVTSNYFVTSKGNVSGYFKFTLEKTDIYEGATYGSKTDTSAKWKKYQTSLTKYGNPINNTVTDPCSAEVKLMNSTKNTVLVGKDVSKSILFDETITGKEDIDDTSNKSGKNITLTASPTGSNGVVKAEFINNSKAKTGIFIFKFNGDDLHEASECSVEVEWSKITPWYGSASIPITNLLALEEGQITTSAYYKPLYPTDSSAKEIIGMTVNKSVTFYDKDDTNNKTPIQVTGKETSNSASKTGSTIALTSSKTTNSGVTATFTPTSKGDVKGIFTFSNGTSDLYNASSKTFTDYPITWNKRESIFEFISSSCMDDNEIEVKQKGTVKVQLMDSKSKKNIPNADVNTKITFKDKNKNPLNSSNSPLSSEITSPDKTDSNGYVSLSYTNNVLGNVYGIYYFSFENDIYHFTYHEHGLNESQSVIYWKKIPIAVTLVERSGDGEVDAGEEGKVTIRLNERTANGNLLKDFNVTTNIKWLEWSSEVELTNVPHTKNLGTKTDSNGLVSASAKPRKGSIKGEYTFTVENNIYESFNESWYIKFFNVFTRWELVSNNGPREVFQKGIVEFQLLNSRTVEPIKDTSVEASVSFRTENNKEVLTEGKTYSNIKTDSNGIVKLEYTPTTMGDITGDFHVELKNHDIYQFSDEYSSIYWSKIYTKWTCISNSGETEVTLNGSVKFQLCNSKNLPIGNQNVDATLTFLTFEGTVSKNENQTFTGKKTDTNGYVTLNYTPTKQGDVKGTFTATKLEDNIYKYSYVNDTIRWNKIQTKLTASNVKIYNGRYTNLNWYTDPDWTVASPGTNPDYNNFYSRITTTNTNTSIEYVEGVKLKYVNYKDTLLFETGLTDSEGKIHSRWTRTYQNVPASYEIYVVFNGNDLFKSSRDAFMFEILKRVPTDVNYTITPYTGHETPRYNIPFTIRATLIENGTTVTLSGQTIDVYFNNKKIGTRVTGNTGNIAVTNYRPQVVGNIPTVFVFDPDDLIDKYESLSKEITVFVDKDSPYLKFTNLPDIVTINESTEKFPKGLTDENHDQFNCPIDPFSATVQMFNSIDEHIVTDETVYWFENIGDSFDGNCWETSEKGEPYTKIDEDSETINYFKTRSGVVLIKARTNETWRYYGAEIQSWKKHKIRVIYEKDLLSVLDDKSINIIDGKAEYTVNCWLPVGLYDLKIEYIGPKEGNCQIYANADALYGVNRKRGTKFTLNKSVCSYNDDKDCIEQQVTKQFTALTTLDNEDGEFLKNQKITTDVNKINSLTQKTDVHGDVTRHHMDTEVDHENEIRFEYEQTRKQAGCESIINANTIPLTPIFAYVNSNGEYYLVEEDDGTIKYYRRRYNTDGSVSDITITENTYNNNTRIENYVGNNFPMKIRAYYFRKHYDKYGEEIKKTSNGDVYHHFDEEGNDIYYILNGKTQTPTTATVYNNAESYRDLIPINGADLVWRSASGKQLTMPFTKDPVKTVTDMNGYGEINDYQRITVGTAKVRIHIENNVYFNSDAHLELLLDTKDTIRTYFVEDDNKKCVYNEYTNLDATLKDDDDNPLVGKTVLFLYGGKEIGRSVTNNNGYAMISFIPPSAKDFKYEAIYNTKGIYKSCKRIFTMKTDKQTPKLTASIWSRMGVRRLAEKDDDENIITEGALTNVQYDEPLTITANIIQSDNSVEMNLPIEGLTVKFYLIKKENVLRNKEGKPVEPTYHHINKLLLGTAKTDNYGDAKLTIPIPEIGEYYIWCFFEGDKRETSNQSIITSVHPLYHWAWNGNWANGEGWFKIEVDKQELYFKDLGENSGKPCTFGENRVQLLDRLERPVPTQNINIVTQHTTLSTMKTEGAVKANNEGIVGVKHLETSTETVDTNYKGLYIIEEIRDKDNKIIETIPHNIGDKYSIKYSFNTDNKYLNRESATFNGSFNYEKGNTKITIGESNPDGKFSIQLVCTDNDKPLKDKNVKFYNGETLIKFGTNLYKTTDKDGKIELKPEEINADGDVTLKAQFMGDEYYNGSTASTKYSYEQADPCNDLSTFDKLYQDLYYNTYNGGPRFVRRMNDRVGGSTVTKKSCCSQVVNNIKNKVQGVYYDGKTGEETSECVGTIPGLVLRSNAFVSTNDCTITFQIKYVCKATNPRMFLGHFGLMSTTAKEAESSKLRFESYYWVTGSNGYYLQNNNYESTKNCDPIPLNKWIDVKFTLTPTSNGKSRVSCSYEGKTYKGNDGKDSFLLGSGYAPYIFVTSNDCEIRIRRISMAIHKKS